MQSGRLTDFAQVEELYRTRMKKDFARNELKPLQSMKRLWEKDAYDCYGLFDGEELLAYAFFIRQGRNYLLDYFAVAEEHRDEGLGSAFMQELLSLLKEADGVLVEIEDPDKAEDEKTRTQRERRREFYVRNGYRSTGAASRLFGVDYLILEAQTGKEHPAEEIPDIYAGFYRETLTPFFFRTQFQVMQESGKVGEQGQHS